MRIDRTHATLEQSKWAEEKGFNKECEEHYYEYPERMEMQYGSGKYWEDEEGLELQPYKLFRSSQDPLPHCKHGVLYKKYKAPEQWQIIKWLRLEHKLHIIAIPTPCGYYAFKIIDVQLNPSKPIERPPYKDVDGTDYGTPEEAYSAAFDHIRNNNII